MPHPPTTLTRRELLAICASAAIGSALRPFERFATPRTEPTAHGREEFVPDVELVLTAALGEVNILLGAATRVWRFTGTLIKGPASTITPLGDSYLGPTLRFRRGQQVRIRFVNNLPAPSIVHWHGLDVPERADGHPRFAIDPGRQYVYEFEVTNRAGLYWYHPHPHMQTGAQVVRGLAGQVIVSDDEEAALGLPSGDAELLCVLQDRRFDANNQIVYGEAMAEGTNGYIGNTALVNGRPRATWPLEARAYRLRVLNGSNARIYKLAWSDGTPMTVLGTDGGPLESPVVQRCVTLAPGQRIDLWLDLGARPVGETVELRSEAFPIGDATRARVMPGMLMGMADVASTDPLPLGAAISLAELKVVRPSSAKASRLPQRLSVFAPEWRAPAPAGAPRLVPLVLHATSWTLAGRNFAMNEVADDETVSAGSTHLWELVNKGGPMGMQAAHPIHVHGRQYRVVKRTGGASSNSLREGLVEAGWMDTVLVLPEETVQIQLTFGKYPGLYLYHCHILEHEDMGMMRNFRVVAA